MARPTIADVAHEAGVSVATVDRMLNARRPVREATANRILLAAERLGYHATGLIRARIAEQGPGRVLAFILQKRANPLYQALGEALTAAARSVRSPRAEALIEYVDELMPKPVAARLDRLGASADAVAVVAVNHPAVREQTKRLMAAGKPVVALLSDLEADSRTAYVGIEYEKAGRTAGWAVERLTRRAGTVAPLVGSHRYLSQETNLNSFRAYLKERTPHLRLLGPAVTLENADVAYEAGVSIIESNPDLAAIYIVGGGREGIIRALRESGRASEIVVVCHGMTSEMRSALADGVVDFVISLPVGDLARATVEAMIGALEGEPFPVETRVLPQLHVSESV